MQIEVPTTIVSGSLFQAPSDLRMVAVFRADLLLPAGKLAAQAGHAFLTAWRASNAINPGPAMEYASFGQTKIVLVAPDLPALHLIAERSRRRGVASALIEDAGRTVLPGPTFTCLGIGPMSKTDCNAITRGLEMMA